jgi:hypothetical protein
MGFADSRNKKLEEECSPEGLEEVGKELSHAKNLFRNRKSKRRATARRALQ